MRKTEKQILRLYRAAYLVMPSAVSAATNWPHENPYCKALWNGVAICSHCLNICIVSHKWLWSTLIVALGYFRCRHSITPGSQRSHRLWELMHDLFDGKINKQKYILIIKVKNPNFIHFFIQCKSKSILIDIFGRRKTQEISDNDLFQNWLWWA